MVTETTDIIYAIVDIETTGGKFNQEKITEIAIFKIKNDGNISVYHQLINPKKKIQLFSEGPGQTDSASRGPAQLLELSKRRSVR